MTELSNIIAKYQAETLKTAADYVEKLAGLPGMTFEEVVEHLRAQADEIYHD